MISSGVLKDKLVFILDGLDEIQKDLQHWLLDTLNHEGC